MILDLVPENDPFLSEPIPSYNFGFGGASRPTRWMKWDKLEAGELAKILIENMYLKIIDVLKIRAYTKKEQTTYDFFKRVQGYATELDLRYLFNDKEIKELISIKE